MAVVRCPKHDIPYNDENPRGCPACAAEREGGRASQVMRELAQASRSGRRTTELGPDDHAGPPETQWPPPVTQPPRVPTHEPGRLERTWRFVRMHRRSLAGVAVFIVFLVVVWYATRPTFAAAYDPPQPTGNPLPLPVQANAPVASVFAVLGVEPPRANPDSPMLVRYNYGPDVQIDALNDVVYAITVTTPNRTWSGLRVGSSEAAVVGRLALLGAPHETITEPMPARDMKGYSIYPTPRSRPTHLFRIALRPPNGCYDVEVRVVPQILGHLIRQTGLPVVVAYPGAPLRWVTSEIRVVSRALPGPYVKGPPACTP